MKKGLQKISVSPSKIWLRGPATVNTDCSLRGGRMSGNGPRRRVAPDAPPALPDFPQIAGRGTASGAPPRESRPALTQLVSQQPSNGPTGTAVVIKRHPAERVLERLRPAPVDDGAKALPAGEDSQESFEQRWNGALGCKTSEAAL